VSDVTRKRVATSPAALHRHFHRFLAYVARIMCRLASNLTFASSRTDTIVRAISRGIGRSRHSCRPHVERTISVVAFRMRRHHAIELRSLIYSDFVWK